MSLPLLAEEGFFCCTTRQFSCCLAAINFFYYITGSFLFQPMPESAIIFPRLLLFTILQPNFISQLAQLLAFDVASNIESSQQNIIKRHKTTTDIFKKFYTAKSPPPSGNEKQCLCTNCSTSYNQRKLNSDIILSHNFYCISSPLRKEVKEFKS